MIEKTDVVIIGAGPVGLFAIFELGLLNISCHVIDNLDKPGGQCAELYPEKPIYDIPSRVSISGQELTDDLLAQAKPFKPVYHLSQQVEKIEKLESGEWLIMTSVNKSIKAKCIVIAAGAGSFVPRKLPISDIAHLEEKNILYAVRNKSILEGKKLLIVGGGDSALDWTNELSKTSNVTLMHSNKAAAKYHDKLLRRRGQNIAITETVSASNQGTLDSWKIAQDNQWIPSDSGKEWISAFGSARTCEFCSALHGVVVGVNEMFPDTGIGKTQRPPLHVNCRCTMGLTFDEPRTREVSSVVR